MLQQPKRLAHDEGVVEIKSENERGNEMGNQRDEAKRTTARRQVERVFKEYGAHFVVEVLEDVFFEYAAKGRGLNDVTGSIYGERAAILTGQYKQALRVVNGRLNTQRFAITESRGEEVR